MHAQLHKYFVAIIAIISKENDYNRFNPGSEDTISAGDSLMILGNVGDINALPKAGCNDYRIISGRVSKCNFRYR